MGTRRHVEFPGGVGFIEGNVRGLDRQSPSGRHRVPGVESQVQKDLFDLNGVQLHRMEIGAKSKVEVDIAGNEAADHGDGAGKRFVERQHLGLKNLLAAEGEKLAGHTCGPLPGF